MGGVDGGEEGESECEADVRLRFGRLSGRIDMRHEEKDT